MSDITVTLCNPQTGQSESIPVSTTLTVQELIEWSKALLGMDGDVVLMKDGQPLTNNASQSLTQAGVANGDLLVVMKVAARPPVPAPVSSSAAAAAGGRGGGGLDFSNLLGSASAPAPAGGGLNFGNLLASAGASRSSTNNPTPIYYPEMSFHEALEHNPHPKAIVKLIQDHQHLFKEFNFRNPVLAQKLHGQSYENAVKIWRESIVKGSIQSSVEISQTLNKDRDFKLRLQQNPEDKEAKEYFEGKKNKKLVEQQYMQAMQEYPESMGRVLMLYIEAKINGFPLQAFVDSGAQMTVMSKKCAQKCGILHLVDTRFAGYAVGVGKGKILGKVHIVHLQFRDGHFPCSVTVMDDAALPEATNDQEPQAKDMDFLLGLDMLKRHTCSIDLEQSKLKFRLAPGQYLETPFLHEKDLDESKGGTKGFDADKANQELMKAQQKFEEEGKDNMEE